NDCLLCLHLSAAPHHLHSLPPRRSSDLVLPRNFTPATGHEQPEDDGRTQVLPREDLPLTEAEATAGFDDDMPTQRASDATNPSRSEEHTSELQSREKLGCRLLLEKKNT